MNLSKDGLITELKDVFRRWEEQLAGKGETDLTDPRLSSDRSIKDVVAHLHAWQRISIADVEAVLQRHEPKYPEWLGDSDPFYAEDHLDEFNARIRAEHRDRSWAEIYNEWREGFRRFLTLSESIPEEVLLAPEQCPWLRGHALAGVLRGSLEHHREHLESVTRAS